MKFFCILQYFFFFTFLADFAQANYHLCDSIQTTDQPIELNQNERILVCGRGDGPEGWQATPLPQAELHLKAILGQLGYFHPEFHRDVNKLTITVGPRSDVKSIRINGNTQFLDLRRKRKIVNHPITPAKLNELEQWANLNTKSNGYPCSTNNLKAYAEEGLVVINSDLGPYETFPNYTTSDFNTIQKNVLERYQPFDFGDPYDIRKTQIMTSRMISDGLFQTAYFQENCSQTPFSLHLEAQVGRPNILRFGLGASTEEAPFIDASYRNTHIDRRASSYTVTAHASPRLKSIEATSELFLVDDWPKTFFTPHFEVAQKTESSFEINTGKIGINIGRYWDSSDIRFQTQAGPAWTYTKTLRGLISTDEIKYSSVEALIQLMSHTYEYGIQNQYEGWVLKLSYKGQNQSVGSAVDLNRFNLQGKILMNLGNYSPPLFVLGTRFEISYIDRYGKSEQQNLIDIPIEDRIYLGGDQNLRGFERNSINNSGLGYMAANYLGLELRLIEELPFRLQPFLLYDIAQVARSEGSFESLLLASEGIGLRWASPLGVLRGSAARGYIINKNSVSSSLEEKWVYFLSFGKEF